MAFRTLNKITARNIISDYEKSDEVDIDRSTLTTDEKDLRIQFGRRFAIKSKLNAEEDYPLGLILYTDWLALDSKIDLRNASDDGFWRNLTCRVVPDYVLSRWPAKIEPNGISHWNADRFYKKPQRNWLKIIWWMCHLSWQGDPESTKKVLNKLGSDSMSQVVERTGKGGYNIDLYRKIIATATSDKYPKQNDADNAMRRAMKMNTMRAQTTIPEFHNGGLQGYVDNLFKIKA